MKIFTEINPKSFSNIYLLTDNDENYGIIIDPGSFALNVYNLVKSKNIEIKKIIITHNGKEQTGGIPLIKKIFDAKIYSFSGLVENFDAIKIMNGSIIREGRLKLKIIETPVYSYDSISILTENVLLVGNAFQTGALYAFGGEGKPSSYEQKIIKSLLYSLTPNVIIYPGKGPATTIELEQKFNPFFK